MHRLIDNVRGSACARSGVRGPIPVILLIFLWFSAPADSLADALFSDATERSGLSFEHFNGMSGELYFPEMMGSGVALLDYDGDGDVDVYAGNLEGSNALYRNDSEHNGRSWLKVKLVGTVSNRDGIGARVVARAGGRTMIREISGGSSYLSRHSLTAHFGLGEAAIVDEVTIQWPSGILQTWTNQAVNSFVTVTEDPTPLITMPLQGSTLDGDTETFNWTDNGSGVTNWQLSVGTSPGAADIFLSPFYDASVSSATVTGLPTDGSSVYVQLEWTIGSKIERASYTYTSFDPAAVPAMILPAPGAILAGDTEGFAWSDNGSAVTDWQLRVGTFPGAGNIYDSGVLPGARVSDIATGLPLDGSPVFVRLSYTLSSGTRHIDYAYTAFNKGTPGRSPEIYSPIPGTRLPGNSATFGWTGNGAPVTRWRIRVSTSRGANEIYQSPIYEADVLSDTVAGLPTDGSTVYVELKWIEGEPGVAPVQRAIYTYTALPTDPGAVGPAVTSPSPGATLFGPDATFKWVENSANVIFWRLIVGTTLGGSDVYSGDTVDPSVDTAFVTGLPQDGSPVYARLYWLAEPLELLPFKPWISPIGRSRKQPISEIARLQDSGWRYY